MGRIVVFVFIAFLIWLVFRLLGGARKAHLPPAAPPPPTRAIESITQCAWCGVHVPAGQALALPDGRIYCCEPHREAARGTAAERTPS